MKRLTIFAIFIMGFFLVNGQVKKAEVNKDDLFTAIPFSKKYLKQRSNLAINIWGSLGMGHFFTEQSGGSLGYWNMDFSMTKLVETNKGLVYKNNSVKFRVISGFDDHFYGYRGELGLLYGKTFGSRFQGNISAGIGVLRGMERVTVIPSGIYSPPYKNSWYYGFNIPLELGISFVPSRFFGLGLAGIASINLKHSLVGIYFKLEWGKIR
jgi:hypothetical protein